MITPDLIPDEAQDWLAAAQAHDLDRIFLVAPSSTDQRLASTAAATSGFLYASSVMGVTGARDEVSSTASELVSRVREHAPELPVGVGLGVRNGAQAAEVAAFADAVIVGSAFVTAAGAGVLGRPRPGRRPSHRRPPPRCPTRLTTVCRSAHSAGSACLSGHP